MECFSSVWTSQALADLALVSLRFSEDWSNAGFGTMTFLTLSKNGLSWVLALRCFLFIFF